MTVSVTSRLARLREGTRDAHSRIEMVPALKRLLAPDLTRQDYIKIIQHLHAFHAHVEPVVAAELELFPEAAALLDGSRPRALADDLAWFGADTIRPPALPEIDEPAAALGALYVIEGSGLGGRVIARHLVGSLGVAPGTGGSFYCRQDADEARSRWQRFTGLLETSAVQGETAERQIVAGAREAFRSMETFMLSVKFSSETTNAILMAEAGTP